MDLAKLKGWTARLLDFRDRGVTTGEPNQDGADAFPVPGDSPEELPFSPEERELLLAVARNTAHAVVRQDAWPEIDSREFPARLTEPKGCFVTLTKQGQLRGCIGHIVPQEPLYQAIMENARNAAVRDSRFPPVQPGELDQIEIEISVLTQPQPLLFATPEELLDQLRPPRDGIVLRIGNRTATFLPQVWAHLPDKVEFLNNLAQKAGGHPTDWRKPETTVSVYQVESFHENAGFHL